MQTSGFPLRTFIRMLLSVYRNCTCLEVVYAVTLYTLFPFYMYIIAYEPHITEVVPVRKNEK